MIEFQRILNAVVIHNSNTDVGSNSNLLIFKVILIVIYYIDLGSNYNSNSNILIFKVIVIVKYYVIDPMGLGLYPYTPGGTCISAIIVRYIQILMHYEQFSVFKFGITLLWL